VWACLPSSSSPTPRGRPLSARALQIAKRKGTEATSPPPLPPLLPPPRRESALREPNRTARRSPRGGSSLGLGHGRRGRRRRRRRRARGRAGDAAHPVHQRLQVRRAGRPGRHRRGVQGDRRRELRRAGPAAAADLQGPDLEGRANPSQLRCGDRSYDSHGTRCCTTTSINCTCS